MAQRQFGGTSRVNSAPKTTPKQTNTKQNPPRTEQKEENNEKKDIIEEDSNTKNKKRILLLAFIALILLLAIIVILFIKAYTANNDDVTGVDIPKSDIDSGDEIDPSEYDAGIDDMTDDATETSNGNEEGGLNIATPEPQPTLPPVVEQPTIAPPGPTIDPFQFTPEPSEKPVKPTKTPKPTKKPKQARNENDDIVNDKDTPIGQI